MLSTTIIIITSINSLQLSNFGAKYQMPPTNKRCPEINTSLLGFLLLDKINAVPFYRLKTVVNTDSYKGQTSFHHLLVEIAVETSAVRVTYRMVVLLMERPKYVSPHHTTSQ